MKVEADEVVPWQAQQLSGINRGDLWRLYARGLIRGEIRGAHLFLKRSDVLELCRKR